VTHEDIPKPIERGNLRLRMGSIYFSSKRFVQWYLSGIPYAVSQVGKHDAYQHKVVGHRSQRNKVRNLQLAITRLDGLILHPGETMSVWRLVGRPSKRKGYLPGMVLINGEMRAGYGGGLCQLSNLIYWMTLHTSLTVIERFRHQYDVFPDSNRTLPFGSGATIAYNYIDLQIRNDTTRNYILRLELTNTHLVGEWRSNVPEGHKYEVIEKNHHITQHTSGKYLRHNQLWRKVFNDDGTEIQEECVAENHAVMMYSPLLQSSSESRN
jgi:vancomycin resistance protein VanW